MNDIDKKDIKNPDNCEQVQETSESITHENQDATPDPLPFLSESEKTALRNAGLPIDHPMIIDMLRKCPD